jgi:hypothetical protein
VSILDKLKNKTSNNKAMENIALTISGYENEFFLGSRVDTGEIVKIKLRDFSSNSSKFSRPTIDSFQKPGSNLHTKLGGVILFDGCYLEDGYYSAKWASVLSSEKGKAYVVAGMARLSSGISKHDKQWMKVDFAKSKEGIDIIDAAQFKEVVTQGLNPVTAHSNPFVMIRITDETGEMAMAYANVSKYKDKENYQATMDAADSYVEFTKTESFPVILEAITDPSIVVEVIYAVSIFAGPATLNNYFTNAAEKQRLESHYLVTGMDEEGNNSTYFGYTNSIVVMRKHGDGTPFITHIKPIMSNSLGVPTTQTIANKQTNKNKEGTG